ncbi:MAG: hypothetical protein Q4C70_07645 [Planctomycetia bacterium]|nr:hypothetical protein [Planctomycetia bacterium]
MLKKIWKNEEGGLVLEWIFLFTVLVIGIVGIVGLIRDALIIEASETASAAVTLDTGYAVKAPPAINVKDENGNINEVDVIENGFKFEPGQGSVAIQVNRNNGKIGF